MTVVPPFVILIGDAVPLFVAEKRKNKEQTARFIATLLREVRTCVLAEDSLGR